MIINYNFQRFIRFDDKLAYCHENTMYNGSKVKTYVHVIDLVYIRNMLHSVKNHLWVKGSEGGDGGGCTPDILFFNASNA